MSSTTKRRRVLISHQGCVPIYRMGVFGRLAKVADIDYVVAHGKPPSGTGYLVLPPPYEFSAVPVANHEFFLGNKSVIWQSLIVKFCREYDAVILGDEAKYLSHLLIIICAKVLRRPVVLWGFGYNSEAAQEQSRGLWERFVSRLGAAIRGLRLKYVDGYLAYTQAGADALASQGIPMDRVVAVNNTVDIEYQRSLQERISSETDLQCRRMLGVPQSGSVLVYFGRFLPEKRIDLLIEYIDRCDKCGGNVWALIFGGGPEEKELRRIAQGVRKVIFRNHNDNDLTRALRIAAAVVVPEYVGLAVSHAFAHSVPFVTREGKHGPELTYLSHGENGLLLLSDKEAFFGGLDEFLSDPELQKRLRSGAMLTADRLSGERMAADIDGLMRRLLRMPCPKGSRLGHRLG